MNIRKEALEQLKRTILKRGDEEVRYWLFRTLYSLPISLTREAYRFSLNQFKPVSDIKWPHLLSVKETLILSDNEINNQNTKKLRSKWSKKVNIETENYRTELRFSRKVTNFVLKRKYNFYYQFF